MSEAIGLVNDYLVSILTDILEIEKAASQSPYFSDITQNEVRAISAIGIHTQKTASEVAEELNITRSTASTTIKNLEKKDYIKREHSKKDRRVVYISLSKKGKLLYRISDKFRHEMVESVIENMTEEEIEVMMVGLEKLHTFLEQAKKTLREDERFSKK